MNLKKISLSVLAIVLSSVLLSSCGKDVKLSKIKAYNLPEEINSFDSCIVAENENIELGWDYDNTAVTVRNKKTNQRWSTIPEDVLNGKKQISSNYVANNLCSTLFVKYVDVENNVEVDLTSNSDASYISADMLKTGIRLTYYFDEAQISIPVSYRLEQDGVSVSVEVAHITEAENHVYEISLLPFFASAENNTDSYIFVPSGSGALMMVDDTERKVRNYTEEVYGDDISNQPFYQNTEKETVRVPVFGVKDKDNALFAIITDGAETAEIKAVVGEERFGRSAVYPTFNLRGKSEHSLKGSAKENNKVIKYSEEIVNIPSVTVRYTMLEGDKANYNGMADYYRYYLTENGLNEAAESPDAMLSVLGGVNVRKLFLGIPYHTYSVLTDFNGVKNILKDIIDDTGASLAVNLKGYGPTGLDFGKYAGGYKVAANSGGKKGLRSLASWTESQKIDTFFDIDTIFFTDSYKSFKIKNGAKSPGDVRAKYYDYTIVVRERDTANYSYLADRYSLATSSKNLIIAARDFGVSGIGLSTLTKTAYSDYSRSEYYCKAHMSDDVSTILSTLEKNKVKSFGESANDYAAIKLDYIFGAPDSSSKFHTLDKEIPFYQMVFRGHTALSCEPINLAVNPNTQFLNAMLTGSSLGFVVADSVDSDIATGKHSSVGSSIYSGIKDQIKEYITKAKPLYSAIGTSEIISYENNDGVAKTVFSNGTVVIANFNETAVNTELGEINSGEFKFGGKESK